MQQNTEARLARRFVELTAKPLTGDEWTKAQVLLNSGILSREDKQNLVEIVLQRDYYGLITFNANQFPIQPAPGTATPVLKGWKEFKRMTLKSLWAMWEFVSGVFMVIFMSVALLSQLFYRKMLKPAVKNVCRVIRKCSGWLIGLFCLILGFCWWVVTSSLSFVLMTLSTCFGWLCRLFAGDVSVISEVVSEQCKANHTVSGNTTQNNHSSNSGDPACCKKVPKFDFLKYWDETPVARQMVMNHLMQDVKTVKSSFRNVLNDMVTRDLVEQKALLKTLQIEMDANRASMAQQGSILDTIVLMFSVYVTAKSISFGSNMFRNTPGGSQLREASVAQQARIVANVALRNVPEVAEVAKGIGSWMSWDGVKTVVAAASKHAPVISSVGLGLGKFFVVGGNGTVILT